MALSYSNPPQSWAQSEWTEGTGGTTNFGRNGDVNENTREYGLNPWGRRAILWKCTPNGTTYGADGGWNTNLFSVDNTYLYRYSCWYRRDVIGTKGYAYLGTNGYGTTNGIYDYYSNLNTNPYLWIAVPFSNSNQMPVGKWILVVGHVFPYNYTLTGTTTHPQTGAWKVDGTEVSSYYYLRDFKWHSSSTSTRTRSYLYYCDTDTDPLQYMIFPRVDKCDGTEPTLKDLLRDGRSYMIANLLIN